MCNCAATEMASDSIGAANLPGSSNVEMDDSVVQNDAAVTFTNHTGVCCICIGSSYWLGVLQVS